MRNRKDIVVKTPHSDKNVEWLLEQSRGKIPRSTTHEQLESGKVSEHRIALRLRTTPITWGIPMDELMYSKFFNNFMHLNIMPWDSVITTESTYLPDARNYIHEVFVDKFKTSHLFMLDSDVLPHPQTVERLIKHDLPVVGGWYRKKESFQYKDIEGNSQVMARPVVYDWVEEKDGKFWFSNRMNAGVGLERISGLGMGCVMMSREVALKLGSRPYDMNAGGEDLVLCKKLMDLDIPLHVDWDLACAHVGVSYV